MSLIRNLRSRARAALLLAVLVTVSLVLSGPETVFAHEGREVGDYNFIVGFIDEPAIEGMLNGVSVRITSIREDGHEDEVADGGSSHAEIDLVSHGGVFVNELAAGATYGFTFDRDFEGLTVPFHAHPVETQGSIMIGQDNPAADEVVVEIHDHGFEPAVVMIQADTKVTFVNRMAEPTVVMSGPLGARLVWTPEIFGTWHHQIIAFKITDPATFAGDFVQTEGPLGTSFFHFVDFGEATFAPDTASFFEGWADFTMPMDGDYVFFIRGVPWLAPFTPGPFAVSPVFSVGGP